MNGRHVACRAGLSDARPADDEGLARTTFIEAALAAAKRSVVGDVASLFEAFALVASLVMMSTVFSASFRSSSVCITRPTLSSTE